MNRLWGVAAKHYRPGILLAGNPRKRRLGSFMSEDGAAVFFDQLGIIFGLGGIATGLEGSDAFCVCCGGVVVGKPCGGGLTEALDAAADWEGIWGGGGIVFAS